MTSDGIFRRRNLPHWEVEGRPIFITACLAGSLSAAGLARIRRHRSQLDGRPRPEGLDDGDWERRKQQLQFEFVDRLLDHESPVRHLGDPQQASIVQDAMLHFAEQRYRLLAFVVMPSHHHWLFLPDPKWSLSAVEAARIRGRTKSPREIISHSIQSYTATMCNRLRGTSGTYWQGETFDRWARDEDETMRIIAYIENNPVAAGLVSQPESWLWSSARIRHTHGLGAGDPIRSTAE